MEADKGIMAQSNTAGTRKTGYRTPFPAIITEDLMRNRLGTIIFNSKITMLMVWTWENLDTGIMKIY